MAQMPLPLSDDDATGLLIPHEIVRDPVQNDITITALERAIIDTPAFQRLRSLNQLGPTQVVYPGAVHTRFIHSLGTLECADRLVGIVNRNYSVYSQRSLMRIDPYPHLLVRLSALLHDVAHMPFGHTLEDEGNLARGQWKDPDRATMWLGEKSDIARAIIKFLSDAGVDPAAAERFVQDIRRYVLHDGDPTMLPYPFVVDLVGNTLCADLLDYLDRDMYFCGLRERSGDRVVKYLAVVRILQGVGDGEVHGKKKEKDLKGVNRETLREYLPSDDSTRGVGRAVLLAYRFEREHLAGGGLKPVFKAEILSEAIDLLRRRFALAEKVYFHRTKIAASAMLISAVGSATLPFGDLRSLSDGDFIGKLKADGSERTRHLTKAYEDRRLYKALYRLSYREERDADASSKMLWRDKYPQFRDPAWRRKTEIHIETAANLPSGSVAIYCPDRQMNLKQFAMLVQARPGGEIKPLENILDSNRKLEMDAINGRFAQLWSFYIFVNPDVLDVTRVSNEVVCDLNAIAEGAIGFPNDIAELQGRGRPLRDQVAGRVIKEWERDGKGAVPYHVFGELVSASQRGEGSDLFAAMGLHLAALMDAAGQLDLDEGLKGE